MISWPENPDDIVVVDALKKGLGRVYLWSQAGKVDADLLVQACLQDYRFDRQVDDPRGPWLWQLLVAAGRVERVKEPILAAVEDIENSDAGYQLCQLSRCLVAAGDERFRAQLRRIVAEKPVADEPLLGEEELMQVDGEAGFVAAVRRHGIDLASREWEWFDGVLADNGAELLGEEHVLNLLETHAAGDLHVGRFRDQWLQQRQPSQRSPHVQHQKRIKALTAADIIAAAETQGNVCVPFRGWGRQAEDSELVAVYEQMLSTSDVESLRRYLQVFGARSWPYYEPRMLQLCLHEDGNIRRRASHALANNRHPEVRRLALEHLEEPEFQEFAVAWLAANFEPGDERLALDALKLPDDECRLHWTLMNLHTLIQDNSAAHIEPVAELIYEKTPCSMCRHHVVKLLSERVGLPGPLLLECPYDADAETRRLVGGPAWND